MVTHPDSGYQPRATTLICFTYLTIVRCSDKVSRKTRDLLEFIIIIYLFFKITSFLTFHQIKKPKNQQITVRGVKDHLWNGYDFHTSLQRSMWCVIAVALATTWAIWFTAYPLEPSYQPEPFKFDLNDSLVLIAPM